MKGIGTTIYMKTDCLKTNETRHCFGKGKRFRSWEEFVLIKSLIYARKKERIWGAGLPNSAENVS